MPITSCNVIFVSKNVFFERAPRAFDELLCFLGRASRAFNMLKKTSKLEIIKLVFMKLKKNHRYW